MRSIRMAFLMENIFWYIFVSAFVRGLLSHAFGGAAGVRGRQVHVPGGLGNRQVFPRFLTHLPEVTVAGPSKGPDRNR